MNHKTILRILVILLAIVLGLITTLATDFYTKATTSPNNIIYSSDNVLYYHAPLVSVAQLKKRGFPFASQAKVIKKYTYEYANKDLGPSPYKNEVISEFGTSGITVQLPAVSTTGSNSFSSVLISWQFYANVITWSIVWLFLGYLIKLFKTKNV
jgi:hypothetical protein